MKQIAYSRDAARALKRMDRASAKRIRAKLDLLARNPEALANNISALRISALRGEKSLMRLGVGDWRLIYTEELIVLTVVRIAARGSVYKGV